MNDTGKAPTPCSVTATVITKVPVCLRLLKSIDKYMCNCMYNLIPMYYLCRGTKLCLVDFSIESKKCFWL